MFDRKTFFDNVRLSLFGGALMQTQVDGMDDILTSWENEYLPEFPDFRWLAYPLATTFHETSQTMQAIEEYGKGAGMDYGKVDPETGQTYYGRGFVQLTWRENYAKADKELGLDPPCEWDASQQLRTNVAAPTMFIGMIEGWFRGDSKGRQTLDRYFNPSVDDAYGAREIINGDKTKVPSWSGGVSIGNLIKNYHNKFLTALNASWRDEDVPVPPPEPEPAVQTVRVDVNVSPVPVGVQVDIYVNGKKA